LRRLGVFGEVLPGCIPARRNPHPHETPGSGCEVPSRRQPERIPLDEAVACTAGWSCRVLRLPRGPASGRSLLWPRPGRAPVHRPSPWPDDQRPVLSGCFWGRYSPTRGPCAADEHAADLVAPDHGKSSLVRQRPQQGGAPQCDGQFTNDRVNPIRVVQVQVACRGTFKAARNRSRSGRSGTFARQIGGPGRGLGRPAEDGSTGAPGPGAARNVGWSCGQQAGTVGGRHLQRRGDREAIE